MHTMKVSQSYDSACTVGDKALKQKEDRVPDSRSWGAESYREEDQAKVKSFPLLLKPTAPIAGV